MVTRKVRLVEHEFFSCCLSVGYKNGYQNLQSRKIDTPPSLIFALQISENKVQKRGTIGIYDLTRRDYDST